MKTKSKKGSNVKGKKRWKCLDQRKFAKFPSLESKLSDEVGSALGFPPHLPDTRAPAISITPKDQGGSSWFSSILWGPSGD